MLAARSDSFSGNVALDNSEEALEEAEVGNSYQARRFAAKALANDPNRDAQLILALALARLEDIGKAQELEDTLNRDAPLDTSVQNYNLPTIRAWMKLHMG